MKYIFYNYSDFISYNNIKFKINQLTKKELVLKNDLKHETFMNGYYNIFFYDNEYKIIYRASKPKHHSVMLHLNTMCTQWEHCTCIAESKDGIHFTKPNIGGTKPTSYKTNIILKGICSSHNFCPIITDPGRSQTDPAFFGIGGLHTRLKFHRKCHQHERDNKHDIVSSTIYHPCHCNGLYLYNSNDLINWNLVQKLPVLTGIHDGQIDNKFGWTVFDGKISCFYSNIKHKYLIYIRSNVGSGIRSVQTAESDDLINWSPFKLLTFNPKFNIKKDNYYHLDVIEYPDTNIFIGLAPYTDNTIQNSYICLLFSHDGLEWTHCGKIMDSPLETRSKSIEKRNSIHTTGVFINNKKDIYEIYLNENYCGHSNRKKSEIVRYVIKKDRLIGIIPKNIGNFQIKIKLLENLLVNFKTYDNGYIKIIIDDISYSLTGDYINHRVDLPPDLDKGNGLDILDFELYKCELYSITTL